MKAILDSPTKRTLLWLELLVAANSGARVKHCFTSMEGDGFEYVTGYETVLRMQQVLKTPITDEMKTEIRRIAAAAPDNGVETTTPALPGADLDPRLAALLAATPIADVCVSISKNYWNWDGEAPQARFNGKVTRWTSKEHRRLCIHWEDACQGKTENLLEK